MKKIKRRIGNGGNRGGGGREPGKIQWERKAYLEERTRDETLHLRTSINLKYVYSVNNLTFITVS